MFFEKDRRPGFRDEHQRLEIYGPFDGNVQMTQRWLQVVGNEFVEFRELFIFDLILRLMPQGRHTVDFFLAHKNREIHKIRISLDNLFNPIVFREILMFILQLKRDFGAAVFLVDFLDGKFVFSAGHPTVSFRIGIRMARFNGDFIGNHKNRIESHSELPDEICIQWLVVLLHFLQELQGSGMGNGANFAYQLIFGHADAGVLNGQCLLLGIHFDADF